MPFRDVGPLRIFEFESLSANRLVHGIPTRRGGGSPPPWESLNVGGTVGDDPERVQKNRRQALAALGLSAESVFDVWQVHSDVVVEASAPRRGDPLTQADAIVSNTPGVSLMMRFADCVPIFLYDPVHEAVGMAHAGWLGTVRQVARAVVRAMVERYRTRPSDLKAGIGPSIGLHHYPIGSEVVAAVRESLGPAAEQHLAPVGGQLGLDLWSANLWLLESEGVEHIEVAGVCTACDLDDWYSHRGEKGRTGRFGALLAIPA